MPLTSTRGTPDMIRNKNNLKPNRKISCRVPIETASKAKAALALRNQTLQEYLIEKLNEVIQIEVETSDKENRN
jgi:hypothetical protein